MLLGVSALAISSDNDMTQIIVPLKPAGEAVEESLQRLDSLTVLVFCSIFSIKEARGIELANEGVAYKEQTVVCLPSSDICIVF